jgi:autotransporter strand-loop-strand O-heptosyltransferase
MSCEFFVGIGSGLSWLAWSLGIRTVLISGFSTPVSEFEGEDVIRIFNPDKCNGCYNRYKFNPGDWNWCPDHKGTERQFECTTSISGRHVIARIVEEGFIEI